MLPAGLAKRVKQLQETLQQRRVAAGLWLQRTTTLVRLSVLVFVPLTIGVVTWLSNISDAVAFLLFPPLAAGTYTLFSNPANASPRTFVLGTTAGAGCGWIAVVIETQLTMGTGGPVSPAGAAFSVLLAGIVTWLVRIDEPGTYSTSLLVLVTGTNELIYILEVAASGLVMTGVFLLYRRRIYQRHTQYLYRTLHGSKTVLVPLWGVSPADGTPPAHRIVDDIGQAVAHFGAQITAASGTRLVLLAAENPETDGQAVDQVTEVAQRLEQQYDITCEIVVVSTTDYIRSIKTVARDTGSDLIVTAFDPATPGPLESLFETGSDVVGLDTTAETRRWRRALVGIRSVEEINGVGVDIATRVADNVRVAHSVDEGEQRHEIQQRLKRLATAIDSTITTQVTSIAPTEYFTTAATDYDLLVLGAGTDRTAVSRAITPPLFYQLQTACDIAVVHEAEQSQPTQHSSATRQSSRPVEAR